MRKSSTSDPIHPKNKFPHFSYRYIFFIDFEPPPIFSLSLQVQVSPFSLWLQILIFRLMIDFRAPFFLFVTLYIYFPLLSQLQIHRTCGQQQSPFAGDLAWWLAGCSVTFVSSRIKKTFSNRFYHFMSIRHHLTNLWIYCSLLGFFSFQSLLKSHLLELDGIHSFKNIRIFVHVFCYVYPAVPCYDVYFE